ncbi:MAG TPA: 2OG-Fe(II) oxygenase [Terriglobales bacterium]|nr:2OG-Fe(II) oxygenase [Terriglobales bacterium]
MTPKQILDSFSETLMQDERILSAQEHALLSTLLQHARARANGNRETQDRETQEAVRAVIASAVGETVAQRAFAVLGGSIVERILEAGQPVTGDSALTPSTDFHIEAKTPKEPDPPGARKPMGEPDPPGVRKPRGEPDPPGKVPMRTPGEPDPPGARKPAGEPDPPGVRKPRGEPDPPGVRKPRGEPDPPGVRKPMGEPDPPGRATRTTVISEGQVAVAERPAVLPANCVVLDEFLAPQELADLTSFVLDHEGDFTSSEVVSPASESGVIDYEHRRSRVLMDLSYHQDTILQRIKAVLPQVLQQLGMEEFSISEVEAQVTASNDEDFFHFHSDNTSERVASRYLTFVYFFHREPRQFDGGELRIHDARLQDGLYVSQGSYQTIVPQQNQIVFFPCQLLHEITPVKCPSRLFADSRFTLNGWLRR